MKIGDWIEVLRHLPRGVQWARALHLSQADRIEGKAKMTIEDLIRRGGREPGSGYAKNIKELRAELTRKLSVNQMTLVKQRPITAKEVLQLQREATQEFNRRIEERYGLLRLGRIITVRDGGSYRGPHGELCAHTRTFWFGPSLVEWYAALPEPEGGRPELL